MIIVKIQGGLGNQMFQYAIGRILALKNNTSLIIENQGLLHPGEGQIERKYLLNRLSIKAKVAKKKLIEKSRIETLPYKLGLKKLVHIKQLVFDENDPKKSNLRHSDYICMPDPTSYYPDLIKKYNADVYLDGYWQSYKFFTGYEKIIKEDFKINSEVLKINPEYIQQIENSQSVSIHFRLKDRITSEFDLKFFRQLELDYYISAVNIIKEKIDNPHFFIFSDDVKWCKEHFKLDSPVTYVNANNEFEDITLMGKCKHHILSHSTFCWWATWLSYTRDKIVITPEKWFNYQTDKMEDLLLEDWIKL